MLMVIGTIIFYINMNSSLEAPLSWKYKVSVIQLTFGAMPHQEYSHLGPA